MLVPILQHPSPAAKGIPIGAVPTGAAPVDVTHRAVVDPDRCPGCKDDDCSACKHGVPGRAYVLPVTPFVRRTIADLAKAREESEESVVAQAVDLFRRAHNAARIGREMHLYPDGTTFYAPPDATPGEAPQAAGGQAQAAEAIRSSAGAIAELQHLCDAFEGVLELAANGRREICRIADGFERLLAVATQEHLAMARSLHTIHAMAGEHRDEDPLMLRIWLTAGNALAWSPDAPEE